MRNLISGFLIGCFAFALYACSFCNRVECDYTGGAIKLQIMRDGYNAVFGPNAIISKDSIEIKNLISEGQSGTIIINEHSQTVDLYIDHMGTYVLEFKNFQSDTLSGSVEVTSMDECCKGYDWSTVTINDQILCVDGCTDIIVLEL